MSTTINVKVKSVLEKDCIHDHQIRLFLPTLYSVPVDFSIAITLPMFPLIIENVNRALSPESASDAVTLRNLEPMPRLSGTVTEKAGLVNTGELSFMSRIVILTDTVSERGGVPLSDAWIESE